MKFKYVCVLLFATSTVFAQSIINPSDSFYDDLRVWETLGLVSNLPPLRPYPEPLVRDILDQVIQSDNAAQSEKARIQQERLFGKTIRVGAEVSASISAGDNNDTQVDLSLLSIGHLSLGNLFSVSYDINLLASNKTPGEEVLPAYSGYRYDTYKDNTAVGLQ